MVGKRAPKWEPKSKSKRPHAHPTILINSTQLQPVHPRIRCTQQIECRPQKQSSSIYEKQNY